MDSQTKRERIQRGVCLDNWKHRASFMKCKTCMWFVEKVSMGISTPLTLQVGRCRRNAPVVGEGYPTVFSTDWCGNHKLDENKL